MFTTAREGGRARSDSRLDPVVRQPAGRGTPTLIDPLALLQALWARKLFVIAMTILGAVVAIGFALATPKLYTATSQVLLDPRDLKVVQNEVTPNGLPSEATLALIESQVAVILSNGLLRRVIEGENLENDPEFNGTAEAPISSLFGRLTSFMGSSEDSDARFLVTLANFGERLSVYRAAKSFVIDISVTTRSPEKSARLSQAVANAFMDDLARTQSEVARRATDALSARLSELREDVSKAERAVEEYKAQNQLVGVGGRLVDDEYIMRVNERLSRGRTEIAELRVRAEQMAKADVDEVVDGAFPEELTSDTLTRLRASYSELAQQAAVLRSNLGPRHPQLIASEEALESAKAAIQAELDRIVAGAQTELARAEATNADLSAQFEALKDRQVDTSEAFVRLRQLEREAEASRAVYEAFLLRARETSEQQSLNTANVRIISQAIPPLQPSSMSRKLIVMVGAMLGFAFGVAIALARALWPLLSGSLSAQGRDVLQVPQGSSASMAAEERALTMSLKPTVHASITQMRTTNSETDGAPLQPDLQPANETGHPGTAATDIEDAPDERDSSDSKGKRPGAHDAGVPLLADTPSLDAADAHEEGPQPADAVSPTEDIAGSAVSAGDRVSLRERVRLLARQHSVPLRGEEGEDDEVLRLQDEIAAVKRHIADLRERRISV